MLRIINQSWSKWGWSTVCRLDLENGIIIMTEDEFDDWTSGNPQPVEYSATHNVLPVYEDREDTEDPHTFNYVKLVRK